MEIIKYWVEKILYENNKKEKLINKSYALCSKHIADMLIKNNLNGHSNITIRYAPIYYRVYRWLIKPENYKWLLGMIIGFLVGMFFSWLKFRC